LYGHAGRLAAQTCGFRPGQLKEAALEDAAYKKADDAAKPARLAQG
jgi:hypothetical protein